MKRLALVQAVLLLSVSFSTAGFIQVQGTEFVHEGKSFYWGGANSYTVFRSHETTDKELRLAVDQGCRVVRIFSFLNSATGLKQEEIEKLDYAVSVAGRLGLRLILVLENFWAINGFAYPEDARQYDYFDWSDALSPEYNAQGYPLVSPFFTNTWARQHYKQYVQDFIAHENIHTGRQYKDEETIMMWELMNEPRADNNNGAQIAAWANEMAQYVKSIDQNHLVATGDEGFYSAASGHGVYWEYGGKSDTHGGTGQGTDFIQMNSSPYIDAAGIHAWPDHWYTAPYGFDGNHWGAFMESWINVHADDAYNILGKPIYLGEFGTLESNGITARDITFQKAFDVSIDAGLSGSLYWHIAFWQPWDSTWSRNDPFGILPTDESTIQQIESLCDRMNAKSEAQVSTDTEAPEVTVLFPTLGVVKTENPTITLSTNERGTVKWSTTDQSFEQMPNTCNGELTALHTLTLNLNHGESYTCYFRAKDMAGNLSADVTIVSFFVDTVPIPNEVLYLQVENLSSDEVNGAYPNMTAVYFYDVAGRDFTGADAVSFSVSILNGETVSGTGTVMAQVYSQFGSDYATVNGTMQTISPEGWTRVEIPLTGLDGIDLADPRSLSISLLTSRGLSWSGDILIDSIRVIQGEAVLWEEDFEDKESGATTYDPPAGASLTVSMAILDAHSNGDPNYEPPQPQAVLPHALRPLFGAPASIGVTMAHSSVRIAINRPLPLGARIEIRTIAGRTIATADIAAGQNSVELKSLPSAGMYIVSLFVGDVSVTRKVAPVR